MRRLPIYFLIDISDSMAGEPIGEVQKGLDSIVCELRNDPYALETAFVSVLAFAGKAKELAPLEEITLFNAPVLPIGPGTSLGAGLDLLMRRIDRDVRKTTAEEKGDWKPVIFLFTDGAPTDNPESAVRRWNSGYRNAASLVAITFGNNADVRLLEQLTDNVLTLTDLSPESFSEFFRWISASLKVSSLAAAGQAPSGSKLAGSCINLEKGVAKDRIDENFAILPIRCALRKSLWLGKYARAGAAGWQLVGSYPVDENAYMALGDAGEAGEIDLATTDAMPECPACRKSVGIVRCSSCGHLSCWPEREDASCPWCGLKYGKIRTVNSLNAGRSRG